MSAVLAAGFSTAAVREKEEDNNADVLTTFINTGNLTNVQKDNFRRGSFSISNQNQIFNLNCDTPIYFTEESAEVAATANKRRVWFNRIDLTQFAKRTASGNNLRSWKSTHRQADHQPTLAIDSLNRQKTEEGFEGSVLWKIHCDWATDDVDQLENHLLTFHNIEMQDVPIIQSTRNVNGGTNHGATGGAAGNITQIRMKGTNDTPPRPLNNKHRKN